MWVRSPIPTSLLSHDDLRAGRRAAAVTSGKCRRSFCTTCSRIARSSGPSRGYRFRFSRGNNENCVPQRGCSQPFDALEARRDRNIDAVQRSQPLPSNGLTVFPGIRNRGGTVQRLAIRKPEYEDTRTTMHRSRDKSEDARSATGLPFTGAQLFARAV